MKKSLIAMTLLSSLILVGCNNHQNFKIMHMSDNEKVIIKEKLTNDEQLLVLGYIMRKSFDGKADDLSNVTIGQAMIEQKEYKIKRDLEIIKEKEIAAMKEVEEKELKIKAEKIKEELQDIINKTVIATIANKVNESSSSGFRQYVTFHIAIENKQDKDIEGVKGVVIIKDIFDDKVGNISFSYDKGIPAKSIVNYEASISNMQLISNYDKIESTPLEKLKIKVDITTIVFKDGKKIVNEED